MSKVTIYNTDKIESQLRAYVRRLARRRNSGTVSADDVNRFFDRLAFNVPQDERVSLTLRVFRNGDFYRVGDTRSSRPEARGRRITEWALYF